MSPIVEPLTYRKHPHPVATCQAAFFPLGRKALFVNDNSVVIILTELPGNTGMSVTNAIEQAAAAAIEHFSVHPGRVLFIEHYPADGNNRGPGGSYDWVTLHWTKQHNGWKAENPVWHRVNREWVEGLLRLKLPDISPLFWD